MTQVAWAEFAEVVRESRRIILTSHIRPDCDALGSELGMAGVLESLGKEVVIVNGQATPPNLAFIDPTRRIKAIGVDVQVDDLRDFDLLMILDTSAWAQLGPMTDAIRALPAKRIVLDHHVSEDQLGATLFKDTMAEATGRLVLDAVTAFERGAWDEANETAARLGLDTFDLRSAYHRALTSSSKLTMAAAA